MINLFIFCFRKIIRHIFLFLLSISTITLLIVLFTEYVLGYPPCELCIYERILLYILIIFSLVGLIYKKYFKFTSNAILLIILFSVFLSGYHSLVERGIFKGTEKCNADFKIDQGMTVDQIKDMLYNKKIATCTKASFKFMGISMAEWNLALNLTLLVLLILSLQNREFHNK